MRIIKMMPAVAVLFLAPLFSCGCYITMVERNFSEESQKLYNEKVKKMYIQNVQFNHGNDEYSSLPELEKLTAEELKKTGFEVAEYSDDDCADLSIVFWFTPTQSHDYEVQVRYPIGEVADAYGTTTHTIYEYRTETRTKIDKWAFYGLALRLRYDGDVFFYLEMEATAKDDYDEEKADLIRAAMAYLPDPPIKPEPEKKE